MSPAPANPAKEATPRTMIGLEVHVQLTALQTKLWCGCASDYRDSPPNTHCCPICLGHPGTLPVLNKQAVEFAITLSLALEAEIHPRMFFYRKNYLYPDMSKNFQISQYNKGGGVPFASGGGIPIQTPAGEKTITLDRLHLEGDPGRLVHQGSITTSPYTLVDYNRCGMALIEIVSNPDLSSPAEAREYLNQLKSIVMHCGIANLNLDGAVRCDANVSVWGQDMHTERTEVKNINSFKEVEQALKWEVRRHRRALERGDPLRQETRHWDGEKTVSLRTKETEEDYRYFPEPDLVPFEIPAAWIDRLRETLPELPRERVDRFQEDYELSVYDAAVLVAQKEVADFFEACATQSQRYKDLTNWIMGDVARHLNDRNAAIDETGLSPAALVELVEMIASGAITGKIAKKYVPQMLDGLSPKNIKAKRKDKRISDPAAITRVLEEVIAENPHVVEDVASNPKAKQALVGKAMQKTRGQIDPQLTQQILAKLLEEGS